MHITRTFNAILVCNNRKNGLFFVLPLLRGDSVGALDDTRLQREALSKPQRPRRVVGCLHGRDRMHKYAHHFGGSASDDNNMVRLHQQHRHVHPDHHHHVRCLPMPLEPGHERGEGVPGEEGLEVAYRMGPYRLWVERAHLDLLGVLERFDHLCPVTETRTG